METTYAILGTVLAFAFGSWLAYAVFGALRTGVARVAGGREYLRTKAAFMYWLTVSIQSLLSIIAFAAGIIRLARM